MSVVNFRPNKGKKVIDTSKPQKIYLRYRLGRQLDFNASIGATVLIENWDKENQRVKNRSNILDRNEINALIHNLTNHFQSFHKRNLENGYTPSYPEVKEYFDSYFTHSENEDETTLTFFQFLDKFIEDAKTKPNPITKKPVSKNTLKDYVLSKNVFKLFNDEVRRFDFNDIDLNWYDEFCLWCNNRGFKDNYKGKHIKTLKTFLNSAIEQGYTENRNHQNRRFSVFKEETESIYLSLDELKSIWDLDLSNEPTKERARDLFLIGCFTGLRVSDYGNIKPSSIKEVNEVKMFVVKTQKTKQTVAIPLHPIVEAILEKYDGIPPRMFDQKINENIKKVVQLSGANDEIETNHTIGGLEIVRTNPKYNLVTTHTARRSFCTNAYLMGMDSLDIMAISGHTTEKNFLKYIKVTPEQRAIKMSTNVFFMNASTLKVV